MKKRRWIAALLISLLLLGLTTFAHAQTFTSEPEGGSVVMPGDTLRYTFACPEAPPPLLRVQIEGVVLDANSVRTQSDGGAETIFGTDGFVVLCDANCKELTVTFNAVMPETKEMPVCIIHVGEERYTLGHMSGYEPEAAAPVNVPVHTASKPAEKTPAAEKEDEKMGETSIWGYVGLGAVVLGFAYGIWRQKTAPQRMEKRKAKLAAKQAAHSASIQASENEK